MKVMALNTNSCGKSLVFSSFVFCIPWAAQNDRAQPLQTSKLSTVKHNVISLTLFNINGVNKLIYCILYNLYTTDPSGCVWNGKSSALHKEKRVPFGTYPEWWFCTLTYQYLCTLDGRAVGHQAVDSDPLLPPPCGVFLAPAPGRAMHHPQKGLQ